MAASSFVWVAYLDSPAVSVHLGGTILTYWDVAKAAASEHLGKRAAEEIGAGAISLRGPVTAGLEEDARAALAGCSKKLVGKIDSPADVYEAWFLLEINTSAGRARVHFDDESPRTTGSTELIASLARLELEQREQRKAAEQALREQREAALQTDRLLKALDIIQQHGDMSSASSMLQQAALVKSGLRIRSTLVTDIAGFEPIATPAFSGWGTMSEEDATPDLLEHFEKHFRLPTGTHVEDVHGAGAFLSWDVRCVDTHGHNVLTHFSGKTDLIVTNTVLVEDVYSAAQGALCLVELKTAKALKSKRAACRAQALLELLSIEKLCGYAVPVVLTNLMERGEDGSGIYIFSRSGLIIRDFVNAEGGPLSLAEANGVLAALLPEVLAERARVDAELLVATFEDGGDDDDDEVASGGAGDEEGETAEGPGSFVHASAASFGAAASAPRRSPRFHHGGRGGGGAASTFASPNLFQQRRAINMTAESPCATGVGLSAREARQYAALEKEVHARHLQSLVDSSPMLQLVLQQASAAANK